MEIERRYVPAGEVRLSDEDGRSMLSGTAIVFGSLSEDLGGFREVIEPTALEGVLERSDVRALFNHEPNLILGRARSGTLRLREEAEGLDYEVDLPDTSAGRDLRESVKRGDVTGSSFAFSVPEDGERWVMEGGARTRYITQFEEIYDVSPVVYPAYAATSVSARAKRMAARSERMHWTVHAKRRLQLTALR